jgi:uncharacterized cupin superfamily protein
VLFEDEVTLTLDRGEPIQLNEVDLSVFSVGMKFKWDIYKEVHTCSRFGD